MPINLINEIVHQIRHLEFRWRGVITHNNLTWAKLTRAGMQTSNGMKVQCLKNCLRQKRTINFYSCFYGGP